MKIKGFDESKYIHLERKEILKRIKRHGRLYLEVGGKLFNDFHASRVLPGYISTTKINLLKKLKNKEIIYCINAENIQKGRIIHDYELTVEKHALKNLNELKKYGVKIDFIVITLFSGEQKALKFKSLLELKGYKVYLHRKINGYPNNIKKVLNGFKLQPYLPCKNNLVIVTGVASNSGKMGVALSQISHESKIGMKTGFAKVETFPIWNLSLNHPINLAYEAATADLGDRNIIDKYHKKAYGIEAVNYNRDIENFSILKKILKKISHSSLKYLSPTDMGINMAGLAIIADKICRKAAVKEIHRRYRQYLSDYKKGKESIKTINRMKEIIKKIKS